MRIITQTLHGLQLGKKLSADSCVLMKTGEFNIVFLAMLRFGTEACSSTFITCLKVYGCCSP